MSEGQDWIFRLVEEKRDKEQAANSHARLVDKIRSEAGELIGRVLEAVRRDVKRLNQEFYGWNVLEISEVSDTGFDIDQQRQLPHATMNIQLRSKDHALAYTLTVQRGPNSYPEKGETNMIQIIVGQNIDDLRYSRNNKLLSPDDVSRLLIEPVVRVSVEKEEEE